MPQLDDPFTYKTASHSGIRWHNPYPTGEMFITKRRERTLHQNQFATTAYVWPETQQLMEKCGHR